MTTPFDIYDAQEGSPIHEAQKAVDLDAWARREFDPEIQILRGLLRKIKGKK